MHLTIETLGGLRVLHSDVEVRLPASKRTRALLAFLALSGKYHRRESLCEAIWEFPDDPKASLRWSLSKIRQIVNTADCVRLSADRERVVLEQVELTIDINEIKKRLDESPLSLLCLETMAAQLRKPVLDGLELPDQEVYQLWLYAERRDSERTLGKVCSCLVAHRECSVERRLEWARLWYELEPHNTSAATALVTQLDRMGCASELSSLTETLVERFRRASVSWSPDARWPGSHSDALEQAKPTSRDFLGRQRIQFCRIDDGANLAFASIGSGTPIVKAANWLSHLEHDWDAPIWSPLFRQLASEHQFVRYDERGNGLSDWQVRDISFEAFVSDLEAVVDACHLDKFSLLGISQGAAVSIEYAVRHPERVKHLILFGGYAQGWRIGADEDMVREREAVVTLTRTGWGRDNPVYRHFFSATFMPSANGEELDWFNEFQRLTTSPENAVRFLEVFATIDVRHQLSKIQVPTLVIHSRRDQRVPIETGLDLAGSIPNAEFVGLDSDGHLLLGRESASRVFLEAVREFLSRNDAT